MLVVDSPVIPDVIWELIFQDNLSWVEGSTAVFRFEFDFDLRSIKNLARPEKETSYPNPSPFPNPNGNFSWRTLTLDLRSIKAPLINQLLWYLDLYHEVSRVISNWPNLSLLSCEKEIQFVFCAIKIKTSNFRWHCVYTSGPGGGGEGGRGSLTSRFGGPSYTLWRPKCTI